MVIMISRRLMKNIKGFAKGIFLLFLIVTGCSPTQQPSRIVLLAPFEGRYREIGYDAIYPARLALENNTQVELLAVDDGGTIETAIQRAKAIENDPLVIAVVVLGPYASDSQVQPALGDLPTIIVGNWGVQPQSDNVFIMANPALPQDNMGIIEASQVTAPYEGSDVFALRGLTKLGDDLDGITILSSGHLPDDEFKERIISSNQFAPSPGLLATSVYEAIRMIMSAEPNPDTIIHALNTHFTDGYWNNAPINTYVYNDNGELVLSTDNVIK